MIIADDPLSCVVRGSGRALEEMDRLATVFTSDQTATLPPASSR